VSAVNRDAHMVNGGMERQIDEIKARLTADVIAALDSFKCYGRYDFLPDDMMIASKDIANHTSVRVLEKYHQLLMLCLIEGFEERSAQKRIPASIGALFMTEFQRIVDEMKLGRDGFYLYKTEEFLKDLGICRLKLYPCGPQLLDELSGIPRRLLLKGGVRQCLEGIALHGWRRNGFKPYYELHMHAPLRAAFTSDGWNACYCRIAELLKLNREIRGVMSTSWWYDPKVETISPKLAYLRKVPLENGARIFFVDLDGAGASGAVRMSETRRKLYESGHYVPALYLMAWARKELISWADGLR
jgi:hypothetical protein